jgi:hypothetical protein
MKTKAESKVLAIPAENFYRYFAFINKRHKIYLDRQAGLPRPWTDDPILQKYKFTNIFRELDRGTIWYREHIREPYADEPELFFNTCMYRHFNYYPTAERIGYYSQGCPLGEYDPKFLERLLRELKAKVGKIYTSAHMISGTLGGDKISQSCWKILLPLWNNREKLQPQPGDTLQKAFERFQTPGYGPFTRYEVITDLRHTRYLQDASDIMTWANPGPGAMRGCERLVGVWARGKHSFSKEQYLEIMKTMLYMSKEFLESYVPALEMRDIEHSLCEWDKYERGCNEGQGHLRAHFVPFEERERP